MIYVPLFYWLDIFAVFQNFEGDFKDHPDSDFPSVIRSSQAVLFTIMPWRAPLCVERVWCLYEALQAVSSLVDLELLVEDVQSSQVCVREKEMALCIYSIISLLLLLSLRHSQPVAERRQAQDCV